jgi:hypothetical protein
MLEKDVAKWFGVCIAIAFIAPFAVNAVKPVLHFGAPSTTAVERAIR